MPALLWPLLPKAMACSGHWIKVKVLLAVLQGILYFSDCQTTAVESSILVSLRKTCFNKILSTVTLPKALRQTPGFPRTYFLGSSKSLVRLMQLYFWLLYQICMSWPSLPFTLFLFLLIPILASTFSSTMSCMFPFSRVYPSNLIDNGQLPWLRTMPSISQTSIKPSAVLSIEGGIKCVWPIFLLKPSFYMTRIFKINKTHAYVHNTSIISQNLKEKMKAEVARRMMFSNVINPLHYKC